MTGDPTPLSHKTTGQSMSHGPGIRGEGFEEEFGISGEARTLVPEGLYEAACTDAEIVELFKFGRSRKLFLHFEINSGEHRGKAVFLPMGAPKQGGKVGVGSKLYATHLIANGGKPPGRRDRLTLKVFKQKLFRVQIRTVQPTFQDGSPKPSQFHYSIVAELLERLA